MDSVTEYCGQSGTGLYYIESDNYIPLRGNGWYYYPMVDYCLQQNIIRSDQIKYVVLSSLSVPYDYNNEFIKAKSGSGTAELGLNIGISYLDSPATTSSTTYKTMGASATSGRNVQFQQSNLFPSSIVLLEIGA